MPHPLNKKGTAAYGYPDMVVLTSQYPVYAVFDHDPELVAAIK